jgi:hypothetical protein
MHNGYQHFLFFKKQMLQVYLTNKKTYYIRFIFIDVIIVIGLLDTGCVKLWAFDPRTATTNVKINIFKICFVDIL